MLHFRQDILKTVKCPQVYLCDAFLPESVRIPEDGKARWFDSYSGYYFTNITMEMFLISKWSMSLHAYYFGMSLHKS